MPSVEDFEECARLMDEFDRSVERKLIFNIPSENGKLKIQPVSKMYESAMETEPMTTTTETVITKTEKTAEDILKSLRDGEYFLHNDSDIQVSTDCWSGELVLDWKPSSYPAKGKMSMKLDESSLEELICLVRLVQGKDRVAAEESTVAYNTTRLNRIKQGK